MTPPIGGSRGRTVLRGLDDPVRSLQDALDDVTEHLEAELRVLKPSLSRRAEISDRFRLIRTVLGHRTKNGGPLTGIG